MRMVFRDRIAILPAMLSFVTMGGAMLCLAQEPGLDLPNDPLSNPYNKPAKITVADDRAYAPFAFLDPEGVPRGVTIDIWNLWSRKTGIPVEFRLMEWEAALAAVRDGEADVVGGLFRTPPREEIFDFTQSFYKISTGVFFPRNIMGIRGLEELNGFMVGVVRGDSAEDTIRANNPAIRLELFPDTESMVKAALAGKIKVFVADTFVVRYYLAKHDVGEEYREAFNLVTDNEQYAAVRKGNRLLLDILQEGFDRISDREIQKIVDSWTGISLFSRIPWTSLWSFVLLTAALLAVMILWNLQLKRKVALATRELWQRNEDLQRSERNYREIFNSTSDMIFIHDAEDGRILDVNQAVVEIFGIVKEEIQGKTVQFLSVDLPSFSKEEALRKIRLAQNAGSLIFEWMCRRANGEIFWAEVSLRGTHIGGENRVLAICRDITERKRTEEMLLQRERILKAQNDILLELMANGKLFRGDFQDAIQEITESCSLLLGVERASVWLYSDDYETILCVDLYELSKKCHSSGEKLRSADFPAYTRSHRQGRVIVAIDVFTDPRTREIPESYYREHDIRSLMDAPIWMGQRIHGLLSFEATGRVREWTQEEERLAHIMAAMVSLGFEIAERKRAEEALREREGILQSLLAAATVGVGLLKDRYFITVNTALCRITGFTENELLGQSTRILYPDEEEFLRAGKALYSQLEREGQGMTEARLRRKDGVFIETVICLSPFDPEDLSAGVCATVLDITEQKRAVNALRESENHFRSMMEQSPFSMMVFSPEGDLLQSNDACVRLWGVSRERSKNYNILKDSNIRDFGFLPLFERAFAGERITIPPHEYDLESTLGQGPRKVVQGDLYPLRDESGAIRYVILVHLDITEQKRVEEEREKLQAQLVQAQKMESVGRLAGGVAHDFNNMLGVILGHAELALDRLDADSPFYADLKEIEKAAQRSADLTRQLLAFARKQTVTPKVLDLNEAIEGMLKMLRRLIGEDIHLAWIPGTNLGAVRIDPSQIDQIMANLCVNARDAIQGNGQITIETKNVEFDDLYCTRNAGFMPGEFIMLAIDDNGCGMDKETQGRVFEPFFTTKEVGQGTGLGLATVFGIVQQNDGFINVYSEPGKGSSFKIYFPRIEVNSNDIQDTSGTKSPRGGGETVLLVEDEPMILNMGQTMLEMLGYRVLAAGTPGEAIRLAEKHAGEIHLLMTDVIMPEMNGRDLAQRLLSLYPNLMQLFMSGYTADVIAHQGVLDEGVTFLQKPFTMKYLSMKIREALERP